MSKCSIVCHNFIHLSFWNSGIGPYVAVALGCFLLSAYRPLHDILSAPKGALIPRSRFSGDLGGSGWGWEGERTTVPGTTPLMEQRFHPRKSHGLYSLTKLLFYTIKTSSTEKHFPACISIQT